MSRMSICLLANQIQKQVERTLVLRQMKIQGDDTDDYDNTVQRRPCGAA